jgi:hypothetical protein
VDVEKKKNANQPHQKLFLEKIEFEMIIIFWSTTPTLSLCMKTTHVAL